MNYGFFRVGCVSPELQVADCSFNSDKIIDYCRQANDSDVSLLVFPELSITSYTCGDLFFQKTLQDSAIEELEKIAKKTSNFNMIIEVGLPISYNNCLYNCAAIIFKGKVLALIPKTHIPNYCEFYEKRYFSSCNFYTEIYLSEKNPQVPFGKDILIKDKENANFVLATEICEDLWVPISPSSNACLAGATVVANLSASNETIGKQQYRRTLVSAHSAKNICAYIYADASSYESSQDLIFSSHSMIYENGTLLKESELFTTGLTVCDVDLEKLVQERNKITTFSNDSNINNYKVINISLKTPLDFYKKNTLLRKIESFPFIPQNKEEQLQRCKEVFTLQAQGLAKRLKHINAKSVVVGLSGGLDSTLALLVTTYAFEICNLDKKNIYSITMPCFGTTDRTYNNACLLAKESGTTLVEINIKDAVIQHFKDINHDQNVHDVTYENAQARERTKILMDYANKVSGIVIGTGDLSELALGWCTYNGDHMSMYGVNSSVPKTLIRFIVNWYSIQTENKTLASVLQDILDTPVSPELLPPIDGKISQKTESLVGPYELHDFYLYYLLRFGFSPSKILFLADNALSSYSHETKLLWLRKFYSRFFSQQFKRSCMPDGAKVGTINLSPRGDWRMPSDASCHIWLEEIDKLK